MSTWGKMNGDKEESMGTNSGEGWVHGEKDMGNGEGRGEEFGKEAGKQGKYNDGQVREAV